MTETYTEKRKMVNITPGVCGNNKHMRLMMGEEDGYFEHNGTEYFWHGGCPACVDERIKSIGSWKV